MNVENLTDTEKNALRYLRWEPVKGLKPIDHLGSHGVMEGLCDRGLTERVVLKHGPSRYRLTTEGWQYVINTFPFLEWDTCQAATDAAKEMNTDGSWKERYRGLAEDRIEELGAFPEQELVDKDWGNLTEDDIRLFVPPCNADKIPAILAGLKGWTPGEDRLFSKILKDQCYWEDELEDLGYALTEMMEGCNPAGYWHCDANGLGWRGRSGYKDFKASSGEKFLQEILPDCDCTYSIYAHEVEVPKGEVVPFVTVNQRGRRIIRGIKIVNSHHDAMGEVYEVLPVRSAAFNGD